MRADYDSKAGTIQIELRPTVSLDRDDAEIDGVIVGLSADSPALIDLIGVDSCLEERLRAIASRYNLDADGLIAAARAAIAAPDRSITVDAEVLPSL
jgi:hypothetical protein